MDNSKEYLKACLRRYYKNMGTAKAKRLKLEYSDERGKPTSKSREFVRKVNDAKGHRAI